MIEAATEVQQDQTQANPFEWITTAGGPAVQWDGRWQVRGLPEDWYSHYDDGAIGLQTIFTEPNSGASGTVMVKLEPERNGVRWEVSFLMDEVQGHSREVYGRDCGWAADFNQAHALVVTWRPVSVVLETGERVWGTDKGNVVGISGGPMSFKKEDGVLSWRLEIPQMEKICEITGGWVSGVQGKSVDSVQMVRDAKLKLAELKGAMAEFVLRT